LSYDIMQTSISLLPVYYEELAQSYLNGGTVQDLRSVGISAEKRMFEACKTNTHKGYIFLSGLILLATIGYDDIREGMKDLSTSFFKAPLPVSNGEIARRNYAVNGIAGECLNGLPSLYEHAIPAMQKEFATSGCDERARFVGLASLMQTTEDTTALHRCGTQGLEIIKADGKKLEGILQSDNPKDWLLERNTYYKSINLTMGGVADLLAAGIAIMALEKDKTI
jgi:triphosphoribosyl-dephospho-CoA synthase